VDSRGLSGGSVGGRRDGEHVMAGSPTIRFDRFARKQCAVVRTLLMAGQVLTTHSSHSSGPRAKTEGVIEVMDAPCW
jgi:hypothetical protein